MAVKDNWADYPPRHSDVAKVLGRINAGLPPGYRASLNRQENRVEFKETRYSGGGGLIVARRPVVEVVDWLNVERVGRYVLRYEAMKKG